MVRRTTLSRLSSPSHETKRRQSSLQFYFLSESVGIRFGILFNQKKAKFWAEKVKKQPLENYRFFDNSLNISNLCAFFLNIF
jgi:hypothetical protein